jgi:vacuolar-type H+-ATPase subunit I/STV1
MATYEDPIQGRGGVVFAAALMVVIGIFQAIEGLVAIFDDTWYVVPQHYTFDLSVTGYGWIELILGIIIALAGFALFAGKTWGGVVAIFLAILSAIANFFFIPYYPFWSILIIGLCIWVIWSVTRPGAVTST